MNKKTIKSSDFSKILDFEIKKNINLLGYYIPFLIGQMIILFANFYRIATSNWSHSTDIYKASSAIWNLNNYSVTNLYVSLIFVFFFAIHILYKEWNGKNKTAFMLLNLPVKRYKILLAKGTLIFTAFIFNYVMIIVSVLIGKSYLIKYFDNNIIADVINSTVTSSASVIDYKVILCSLLIGALCILNGFLFVIAYKSKGMIGSIGTLVFVGTQIYIGFLIPSLIGTIVSNYLVVDSLLLIFIILTSIINIKLFKNNIEI